jgi:hypothetical protein
VIEVILVLILLVQLWANWKFSQHRQRIKMLENKVADLEMGRPVQLEDGPRRLAGNRQDR